MVNKVFQLKENVQFNNGIKFEKGQEIEIVMNVVYIGGYPLPPNIQQFIFTWIKNNPNLFEDKTLNW